MFTDRMSSTYTNIQLHNATIIADELWKNNSRFHRDESLKLLTKIFENIKAHPDQMRYRRINMLKINAKHSIIPEFKQLLIAAGFIEDIDEIHYKLPDTNFDLCTAVYSIILDRINYENELLEIERQKVIQKTNKKQHEYMNARIRKKELVKKRIALDRKDIKQDFKPHLSSKQRDIKYWKKHNIYNPETDDSSHPHLPTVNEEEHDGNA
mmetsp:Transcript_58536/g.52751  ORF Transcript_58536/g.52751 Transcript_58536/m.52751 type:complete len:210 (+) Transcript_58536:48-677(+)